MKRPRLVVLAVGWLLTAPFAAAGPLEDAKAADLAMAKALLDADRDAFGVFLAPEVFFLSAEAPGREAALASWAAYFETQRRQLLEWRPDRGQAAASGELAYTSGPYEFRRTGTDGKVASFAGRYLTLWQKSGEGWQVFADGVWLEPTAGGLAAQLARIWPPAGSPELAVKLERRPLRTAQAQSGDLLLAVGDYSLEAGEAKAKGRYATVAESDGKGGWRVVAEGLAGPVAVE